jgi:hypothetical protein
MKIAFVSIGKTDRALIEATQYHDEPDTVVYMTKLLRFQNHRNSSTTYHYKLYKLYKNEFFGPHDIVTYQSLDILKNICPAGVRHVIAYFEKAIELDLLKGNERGLGRVFDFDEMSSESIDSIPRKVYLPVSGRALLKEDNTKPEENSLTHTPRPLNAALTYFYKWMRTRQDSLHPLSMEENKGNHPYRKLD